MKARRLTATIHVIVWILLLVIPYISTDQVFDALESRSRIRYLFQSLATSSILLAAFYLNYLVLIPGYLFRKKLKYVLFLSFLVTGVILLIHAVFFLFDYRPGTPGRSDSVIEKILPVIIINAMSLWFLAVVCSVLWAYYNRLKESESGRLSAQIAAFKSQINPHFLFNTLNNIYATAIDSAPVAADMIEKLSEMMRYAMTEARQDFVPLEDELGYVSNYIELQRMRLDRSVRLEYARAGDGDAVSLRIAPMLLTPFIENAFKHGVNSERDCLITIGIVIDKSALRLRVVNNKVDMQKKISERSGLGIENTRRRLDLIYPGRHLLAIDDGEKQFSVSLHIDLQ